LTRPRPIELSRVPFLFHQGLANACNSGSNTGEKGRGAFLNHRKLRCMVFRDAKFASLPLCFLIQMVVLPIIVQRRTPPHLPNFRLQHAGLTKDRWHIHLVRCGNASHISEVDTPMTLPVWFPWGFVLKLLLWRIRIRPPDFNPRHPLNGLISSRSSAGWLADLGVFNGNKNIGRFLGIERSEIMKVPPSVLYETGSLDWYSPLPGRFQARSKGLVRGWEGSRDRYFDWLGGQNFGTCLGRWNARGRGRSG